jgi:cell division protein FtsB
MFSLRAINLTKILVGVLILIQFPLWFGDGGWIRVWWLERDITQKNLQLEVKRQRILELEAEARDLKVNPKAAEEWARYELGLIKPGERFVQWAKPATLTPAPTPAPSSASAGSTAASLAPTSNLPSR